MGGFGTEDTTALAGDNGQIAKSVTINDAAIQLFYSKSVMIVPGYGLAVAQAQKVVRELDDILSANGVDVTYAIHPVAGQGFNLALRDISLLSELLACADDAGDKIMLSKYVEQRASDTARVFRFTDTLIKIFSNRFAPLAHLRAFSLLLVDLIPPVKHLLAKQSMGLSGRLSKMNRGLPIKSKEKVANER